MFGSDPTGLMPIDTIAHIIQTALTPVFLLSGIAALLNVFSTRLARVSDRCHLVTDAMEHASPEAMARLDAQLLYLHNRSLCLDTAVLLGTFGGGATCAAGLLLFVGTLRNSTVAGLLYLCFGLALIATTGALVAFMAEMLMASRGLRAESAARRARAAGLQALDGNASSKVRSKPSSL